MGARQGSQAWARRCTYLLEPKNWLIVTVVGVGGHVDGWAGAGWGLLGALFVAVLPTLFISYGVRRGRWADRNVGARGPRLVVLAFITASVAVGLVGVLLVSGLIEALVTPSSLPTFVRVGIGIIAEAAFLAYIVYFGRRAVKAGETGDIEDAPDVVPTG